KPTDGSDPIDNARRIEHELVTYSPALARRPIWMVLSKADVLSEDEQLALRARFLATWPDRPVQVVSALTGEGLGALTGALMIGIRAHRDALQADPDYAAAEAALEADIGADVLASSLARRAARAAARSAGDLEDDDVVWGDDDQQDDGGHDRSDDQDNDVEVVYVNG
ncbi:MAG: hypothetical protein ACKOZX_05730, partial [Gammaproteobacteria bacterium]